MADKSNIEWTDATWNPIVGCSIVSPGCTNCYAMKIASRILNINARKALDAAGRVQDYGTPEQRDDYLRALRSHPSHYDETIRRVNDKPVWTGKVALAPDHILTQPLRWKRGRKIFVNSMGDLFHESIPDESIDKVFAVMALCPQHTFQVLTKRAQRMRAYMTSRLGMAGNIGGLAIEIMLEHTSTTSGGIKATEPIKAASFRDIVLDRVYAGLPNVWLGVSTERQQEADERIPHLLATPAAVRFISAEPLLGPIDPTPWIGPPGALAGHSNSFAGTVAAWVGSPVEMKTFKFLDWVIVGGESGSGARPMHPEWARSIRNQCRRAGVAFFFKQHGEWRELQADDCASEELESLELQGRYEYFEATACHADAHMVRVGKKRAGRLLDGREHNEFPGGQR